METLIVEIFYSFLLVIHFIGDFLFQTREIGEGKSSSIKLLSLHVLIYIGVLFVLTSPLIIFFGLKLILYWVLLNGVLHWITDYFTSRASKKAYLSKNMKNFWWIIGLDQLIHGITLILTSGIVLL